MMARRPKPAPKPTCYIAGPMSSIPEFNFPAFDAARDELIAEGYDPISPADMDRAEGFDESDCTGFEELTLAQRRQFARQDIAAILSVDRVYLLPGWRSSTGARNEVTVAHWLGVPVYEWPHENQILPEGEVFAGQPLVDVSNTTTAVIDPPARNNRATVLLGAEELVNGDRNVQYGDPRADFQRTADLWNTYLDSPNGEIIDEDDRPANRKVETHDVAAMMALLKISRIAWSPDKLDSWMDLAGYAACGWDCAAES